MSFIQNFFTSRDNKANAVTNIGQQGRLWYDPITNSIYVSDGTTPGGILVTGGGGGGGIGATGATGAAGATGTNGTNGFTGATGTAGAPGEVGATGLTGSNGATGLTGNDGATGPIGFKGATGPAGLDGATGLQGDVGATGAQGVDGATGPQGQIGATGLTGNNGATGLIGLDGATGAQGLDGATGLTGGVGATGSNGLDGATGQTGPAGTSVNIIGSVPTTAPDPQAILTAAFPSAVDGNGVVDENTGNLWVLASGTWTDVGQIVGPSGATGPQGLAGATGPQGFTGASGVNGLNGATGAQGLDGATGAQGITGATGPQGLNGATGLQGDVGATGSVGLAGSTGPQGLDGATGSIGLTGATGQQGETGATGSIGLTGATGVQGLDGATGVQGLDGATGATGLQGATGANGLDGATGAGATGPTGATGTGGVIANWGSFWDTTTQTAAINTPTAVTLNSSDIDNVGITVVSGSQMTFASTGVYSLTFSIQFTNNSTALGTTQLWLKKNGINIPDTSSHYDVPDKQGSAFSSEILTVNFVISITAGDYIELYWQTANVNVIMETLPANGYPETPSVIFTATQVTYTQAGPTGATGITGTFDGNLTANLNGNGYTIGNVSTLDTTGNITANYFIGDGSLLSNVSSYGNANVSMYLASGADTQGFITSGNVNAVAFSGDGEGILNVNAITLGNSLPNVSAVADTVVVRDANASVIANTFIGDGTPLTNINAANISGLYGNIDVASGNVINFAEGATIYSIPSGGLAGTTEVNGADNRGISVTAGGNVPGSSYAQIQWVGDITNYDPFGYANAITNWVYVQNDGIYFETIDDQNSPGYFHSMKLDTDGLLTVPTGITGNGNVDIGTNYFIGNGSQLTGLPATYSNADVASYLASGNVTTDIFTTGNISASYYTGDGSQLTGIINVIPAVGFTANATGNNQSFSNVVLASYANASDITLFYNGALLTSEYYSLADDVLTINTPIFAGDNINIPQVNVGNVTAFVSTGYGNANVAALLNSPGVGNITATGLLVNGSSVITGNLVVAGNANVQGTLTYNNVTDITTSNLVLGLGNTQSGINVTGGGIVVGSTNEAEWLYNQPTQTWNSNLGLSVNGNVTTPSGQLLPANITSPVLGQNLVYDGAEWINNSQSGAGSWTLTPGVNSNLYFEVPINGTYVMYVRGNIPNGIVTWTATATVTNTNVPAIGVQYGWYYSAIALVLNSMPAQIIGTAGAISTTVISVELPSNRFRFSITNNTSTNQIVYWGYNKQ